MIPRARRRARRIFAIPAAIAAVTLIGLIAGLLGDGAADLLSWLALGSCLAVIAWALSARRD